MLKTPWFRLPWEGAWLTPYQHPPNTCYHAEFGRSRSKGMKVLTEMENRVHRDPPFKVLRVIGTDIDRSALGVPIVHPLSQNYQI